MGGYLRPRYRHVLENIRLPIVILSVAKDGDRGWHAFDTLTALRPMLTRLLAAVPCNLRQFQVAGSE